MLRRPGSSRRSRTPNRPTDPSIGDVSRVLGGLAWSGRCQERNDDRGSSDDEGTESSRSVTLTSRSERSVSPDPSSSRPQCGVERGQSEPEEYLEEIEEEEGEDEDNGEEDGEEEEVDDSPSVGVVDPPLDPPAFIIRPPVASAPEDLSAIPLPPGRCHSIPFVLSSARRILSNILLFYLQMVVPALWIGSGTSLLLTERSRFCWTRIPSPMSTVPLLPTPWLCHLHQLLVVSVWPIWRD